MIFINLDSFPLPSGEKEGVEKEDREGKTVGVTVKNERANAGYKTQKSGIWRLLVGGQKVKLESPNSDKKSKHWEGGSISGTIFGLVRVFWRVGLLSVGAVGVCGRCRREATSLAKCTHCMEICHGNAYISSFSSL